MGIFDNAFAPFTGIPAGILPPDYGSPQGNFSGGRSVLSDILERIRAGATRGLGAGDFGGNYGIAPSFNYQPQQLPSSPADLALGTNRPQYAPDLAPPVNVATISRGGEGVPQDAQPNLPPNASPTTFAPQPQIAPQVQQMAPQSLGGNFSDTIGRMAGILNPNLRPQLQMMSDFLGNQTPYWVNPIDQTVTEAKIGNAPSSTGIGSANLMSAMSMPQQIDTTTGRDENFIKSLGPVLGAQVTSALNGDSKLDGRMLQKIQPLATRAEPGWSQQTYQQRLGAYKSFYGGGKDQETARALNQSAGHFAELVDKMNSLPGSQMPLFNWAKNTVDTQVLGKGNANNFLINAHAVAAELSRLFKQVNMSDTEIKKWEEGLSPNMSDEQQRGMARTLQGLYQEAFDALEKKRVDGLGPALAAKSPPLIDGHTAGNLAKIQRFSIGQQTSQAGGLPAGWTVTVK